MKSPNLPMASCALGANIWLIFFSSALAVTAWQVSPEPASPPATGHRRLKVGGRSLEVEKPIVVEERPRRWWGFPNYVRDLDEGLRSWSELARSHGHLGNVCSSQTERHQCGTAFVCKTGVCSECTISRDCGEHHLCEASQSGRKVCIRRDLANQWSHGEVLCTVLVVLTAMLSAAAGMGGGGVYVPLMLLLLGLSTKEGVPLSQAMIVSGAIINVVMFAGERHPKHLHKAKIDYEVVMMLNPGLAVGVTIGVMCNLMSPQWLIVLVLIGTLVITLWKSADKGMKTWKKESKSLEQDRLAGKVDAKVSFKSISYDDFTSFVELAQANRRQIVLIVGCWLVFLCLNVLKAPSCSVVYWMQFLSMILFCGIFTKLGARTIAQGTKSEESDDCVTWTAKTLWLYPLFSLAAGFLGGFLGIGGGIIMSPLLLELGLVPEAGQATSAVFVFLSSSLATIQYVVLGKTMPQYVMWFTSWVVVSTFVGQTLVDYILRKLKRSSIIILAVAAIVAGSLVMMTAIGVKDVVVDLSRGADMSFHPRQLCQ